MLTASPRRALLALAIALASLACLLPSASAGGSASGYYAEVAADSPVALWKLDEGSDYTAVDATGHGHNGVYYPANTGYTLRGATTPTGTPAVVLREPTYEQYGPYYLNLQQQVDVPWSQDLNPLDNTYTVEAWVNPSSLPFTGYGPPSTRFASIFCSRDDDGLMGGYHLYIGYYDGKPRFSFLAGTNANFTSADWRDFKYVYDEVSDNNEEVSDNLRVGQWYHVVATVDAQAQLALYVNGQQVSQHQWETASGQIIPNDCDRATIGACSARNTLPDNGEGGAYTYFSHYYGAIANVAFYGEPLTEARIACHYKVGAESESCETAGEEPSVALYAQGSTSLFTGNQASFEVDVANMDPATLSLTAEVKHPDNRIDTIDINEATKTFSYSNANPGTDEVTVTASAEDEAGEVVSVTSQSRNVYWAANATSAPYSYGGSQQTTTPGAIVYGKAAVCDLADPVNTATGNFYWQAIDVTIEASGIPFSLERTYNSRDGSVGTFGKGWSSTVLTSLSVDEAGNVSLKAGSGQEIGFILKEDGSYEAPAAVSAELEKNDDGYEIVVKDQKVQRFDLEGRLLSTKDLNGKGLDFTYDGQGRLEKITDSGGRVVTFTYDAQGRIERVTLPDATTLAYGYEGELLSTFTDQTGAVTQYDYDEQGFLKKIVDPEGSKSPFENTYDELGRVLTQKSADGNVITFDWTETTASDTAGSNWQDFYNDQNQITKRVDALGNETLVDFDEANNPLSTTDPLGNETEMTYDERGNMLTKKDALGNTESWTYDDKNDFLSHTDQLGNTTTYEYDENGNLLSETDPLGATTTYEYDSAGRVTKEIDPLGRTTRSVYDPHGNLIKKDSPSGAETTYTYDNMGRQLTETDPLGNTTTSTYDAAGRLVKTTDALGNYTSSAYDAAGRLVSECDANGNVTRYEYDDAGRQTAVIAADGSTTRSEYDALGNLVATTDALGRVTRYEYDKLGRQTAAISPTGERTETTYDANGNAVSSENALGNESSSVFDALDREIESRDALGRVAKTFYDAVGNVIKTVDPSAGATLTEYDAGGRAIKETDPLGHSTLSTYDAAGQLVSKTDRNGTTIEYTYDLNGQELTVTHPDGSIETSTYDAAGNLLSKTDGENHTTSYAYDSLGRKVSETDPLGHVTTFSYDLNGNLVSITDPLGHTSRTVYDEMNREVEQIDPLGRSAKSGYNAAGQRISKTDRNGHTTRFDYDHEGRLVKETDPLGGETISEYDKAGRLVSKIDQNGHETSNVYDAAGQKTSVTAPDGSVTSYRYDGSGNVISRTDANGNETTYAYDLADRKIEMVNPLGSKWTYRYDANGNLIEIGTAAGNATPEEGDGTISQAFDSMDRLVSKSYSDGTPTVSSTYDKAGRKLSMTDGQGTTLYAYDGAGRRLGASGPQGAFLYRYDAAGNLLARTYPNGLETTYAYNDAGEMVSATVKGKTTRYGHDGEGRLASTLYPSGLLETRTYNVAGRLSSIETTSKDGKLFSLRSYERDAVGNPLRLIAKGPRRHAKGFWNHKPGSLLEWQEHYTYDQLDRLTKACMNAACSRYFAYSYDPVGNRTKLETRFGETNYAYDEADELLSASKVGRVVERYAYDLNGNQTKVGSTSYSYNLENKLTEVKEGCRKKVSYAYSGDGLMTSRSARNETTAHVWDTRPELAELALETESKPVGRHVLKNTVSYAYGEGAIGQIEGRDEISFHTDALGSVVALSDEKGKLLETYRYSPYGQDYSSSWLDLFFDQGTNESAIRFTGQYLDSDSDLYYMRARNYQAETGRFMQVDPLEREVGSSYVGGYVYADDQPTAKLDPSGMCLPVEDTIPSPCWTPRSGFLGHLPEFKSAPPKAGFNGQIAHAEALTHGWDTYNNYDRTKVNQAFSIARNALIAANNQGRVSETIAIRRMKVIRRALTAYGVPYVWAVGIWSGPQHYHSWNMGENPGWVKKVVVGFDCSGFVSYAYGSIDNTFGYKEGDPLKHGGTWAERDHSVKINHSQLLPGDLAFYSGMIHIALYIGNGQTIQAPGSYDHVRTKPLGSPTSLRRYKGFVE